VPRKAWKVTKYWVIDKDHGDISTPWVKLNKPGYQDTALIDKIKAEAHYGVLDPQNLKLDNKSDALEIKLPMQSSSVTFLELRKN
jgi:beta-xylosidase